MRWYLVEGAMASVSSFTVLAFVIVGRWLSGDRGTGGGAVVVVAVVVAVVGL